MTRALSVETLQKARNLSEPGEFGRSMGIPIVSMQRARQGESTIVDSKLEFNSFFDGMWFKYDQSYDPIGDLYLHVGVFVINENKNQFGYLGEIGIINVGGTGFYTKYSLVNWDTKDFHNKIKNERFDFVVSQLIFGYKFLPKRLQKIVEVYLAGLWNSAARKLKISHHKRANWALTLAFPLAN